MPPAVPATETPHAPRPPDDIAAKGRHPCVKPYPGHRGTRPFQPGQFQGQPLRFLSRETLPLRSLTPSRFEQADTGWHWSDSDWPKDGLPARVKRPSFVEDDGQTPPPGDGEILHLPRLDTPLARVMSSQERNGVTFVRAASLAIRSDNVDLLPSLPLAFPRDFACMGRVYRYCDQRKTSGSNLHRPWSSW